MRLFANGSLLAAALALVPLSCAEATAESGDGTDARDLSEVDPDDVATPDVDAGAEVDADVFGDDATDGEPEIGPDTDEGLDTGPDAEIDAESDGPAEDAVDVGPDPGADGDADFVPDADFAPEADIVPDVDVVPDVISSCVSGAPGRLAVRFLWDGSGPGSTAYVRYEANDLPDSSRWHVTAASASIGYTPPFDDTYLGEGGLRLDGTAFIDVELSTVGLSTLSGVTIAVYGRSFATTTSGASPGRPSTGRAPLDLVSNSAPYEWYGDGADAFSRATTSSCCGSSGPSGALIKAPVAVCFDAM